MNGCYLKGTPIAVDIWQRPQTQAKLYYFLTHLHSDHIKGLTPSWSFPIYTSPINKSLLLNKFKFSKDIVVELELDVPQLIPIADDGDSLTVTLVDANHVPGAVMFMFQGAFGTIFYCGDMRFYPELFEHPVVKTAINCGGIDVLYLDNTFCDPNYDFPPRNEVIQQLFNIIEEHPNHVIKLGIRLLGKEDLLEAVAQKFQEVILVAEEKYKQLKILNRPNIYTHYFSQSRIHATLVNKIHEKTHKHWNEINPTISILLTAMYEGVLPHKRPCVNIEGMFILPYSDHSSWGELHTFVQNMKPRKIIPIVIPNNKKDIVSVALKYIDDMSVFDKFLSSPHSSPIIGSQTPKKGPIPHVEIPSSLIADALNKSKMKAKKCKRRIISRGVHFSALENDVADVDTTNHKVQDVSMVTHSGDIIANPSPTLVASPITQNQPQSPQKQQYNKYDKQIILEENLNSNGFEETVSNPISTIESIDMEDTSKLIAETTFEANTLVDEMLIESNLDVKHILDKVQTLKNSLELINNCF